MVSGHEADSRHALHARAHNLSQSNRISSVSRSRRTPPTRLGASPRMTEPCHVRHLEAALPFFPGRGCFSIRASHITEVTNGMPTEHRRVMHCPICLRDAKDATPPRYRGLVLECPRCGVYRVTQDAITALGTLKVDERLIALRKAKVFVGSRTPTITSGCLGLTLPRKSQSRSRSASRPSSSTTPAASPPSSGTPPADGSNSPV